MVSHLRSDSLDQMSEPLLPLTNEKFARPPLVRRTSYFRSVLSPLYRFTAPGPRGRACAALLVLAGLGYTLTYINFSPLESDGVPIEPASFASTPATPPNTLSTTTHNSSTVVRAAGNLWSGYKSDDGLVHFLSLPFAETPAGDLRFRKPQPYNGSAYTTTAREAEWFSSPCSQGDHVNEDCLKLNVIVPAVVSDEPLPVMLLIHGGAFAVGSASDSCNMPSEVMNRAIAMGKPVVFVSINYRLGVLGFSAAPLHHDGGPPRDLDLNVGFLDQLMAMEWVNREIRNFGGDPNKVTLVGGSAGAMSVGLHQLYSPRHLYRAAFMTSGAPTSFPVPTPIEAATRVLHPLSSTSFCRSPFAVAEDYTSFIECLRDLSSYEISSVGKELFRKTSINAYFPWLPVLEGPSGWLNELPSAKIARGDFNRVPIVIGSVRDEGATFVSRGLNSVDDVLNVLRGMFSFSMNTVNPLLPALVKLYPNDGASGSPYQETFDSSIHTTAYKMAASLVGDLVFGAPIRFFLDARLKASASLQQWSYLYDDRSPTGPANYGVYHGIESWLNRWPSPEETKRHADLNLVSFLINFVSDMDPNGPGLPSWPQYDTTRPLLQIMEKGEVLVRPHNDRAAGQSFINLHNEDFSR